MNASRFSIVRRLGGGTYGEIVEAFDAQAVRSVAIKFFESERIMLDEYRAYEPLRDCHGIPKIFEFVPSGGRSFMVMELLGYSLEDLFTKCHRKFSLSTVLEIADQLLTRIEMVHERGIVHRDIKPDNLAIGIGPMSGTIFMLDFGLANKYLLSGNSTHIPFRAKCGQTGNARFQSVNSHLGNEQSRRDDLEGIAYMLVLFAKGSLPWMNIAAKTKNEKRQKIAQIKMTTSIDTICSDLPVEFSRFLRDVRQLKFEETPDYAGYRHMFGELYQRERCAGGFDWEALEGYVPPMPIGQLAKIKPVAAVAPRVVRSRPILVVKPMSAANRTSPLMKQTLGRRKKTEPSRLALHLTPSISSRPIK